MTLDLIIEHLFKQQQGDRRIDVAIAEALGWERKTHLVLDEATGEERTGFYWVNPFTNKPAPPPSYTSNLQHAYELLQSLSISSGAGFSWEPGKGGAKVYGEVSVDAATPQLALCIAALKKVAEKTELTR